MPDIIMAETEASENFSMSERDTYYVAYDLGDDHLMRVVLDKHEDRKNMERYSIMITVSNRWWTEITDEMVSFDLLPESDSKIDIIITKIDLLNFNKIRAGMFIENSINSS